MAVERERKFTLDETPRWLEDHPADEIAQGYLALAEETEVRLRRKGTKCTLTVKGGWGTERAEYETVLAEEQFAALWPATNGCRLMKRRYEVPLPDSLTAEVDVYSGHLEGLRVVEVEFADASTLRAFEAPEWFGRDVTGDRAYANRELAMRKEAGNLLAPPH